MDPWTIVLALACVVLGAPEALRLQVQFAGKKSPLADIAICVFVMAMVTAHLLGVALLARFVRKARAHEPARRAARKGGVDRVSRPRTSSPR